MSERFSTKIADGGFAGTPRDLNSDRQEVLRQIWWRRNEELLLGNVNDYMEMEGLPPHEVQVEYEKEKDFLESIFGEHSSDTIKRDLYFHGTGLYKYAGNKYEKSDVQSNLEPVLEKVLSGGLETHEDVWLPDQDTNSISLAESYMYAKCYANKYMSNPKELLWQFGDPNDWLYYFLADTGRSVLEIKNLSKLAVEHIKTRKERKELKMKRFEKLPEGDHFLLAWCRSFRNDIDNKTPSIDLMEGHSNIPNNYGIVFCLDKNKVSNVVKPSLLKSHEVRATEGVTSDSIRAIGVPLVHMDKVKKIIDGSGLNIKIFSLECADKHVAGFPTKEIVKRIE